MFEELAKYPRIVVTGPQRSGTTIGGKIIANDLGYDYVDEMSFRVYNVEKWRRALKAERVVVQCPHMLKLLVDEPIDGVFVVLMRRDLDAIHASEKRIGWESLMKAHQKELAPFGLTEGDSAAIKYDYWDSHPKDFPHLEVEYDSLESHPMYVASEYRKFFHPKQTKRWLRRPGKPGPAEG